MNEAHNLFMMGKFVVNLRKLSLGLNSVKDFSFSEFTEVTE